MDLAQRLSSVRLALLEPSEKLDALDLLCNEVLMTRPMREAMDNRLKQVQSVQHSRQRYATHIDTSSLPTRFTRVLPCAKKSESFGARIQMPE